MPPATAPTLIALVDCGGVLEDSVGCAGEVLPEAATLLGELLIILVCEVAGIELESSVLNRRDPIVPVPETVSP